MQAAFALQFHQAVYIFMTSSDTLFLSLLGRPSSYRSNSCLEHFYNTFILFLFFSLYALFLHFSFYFCLLWCTFHSCFYFPSFHLCVVYLLFSSFHPSNKQMFFLLLLLFLLHFSCILPSPPLCWKLIFSFFCFSQLNVSMAK